MSARKARTQKRRSQKIFPKTSHKAGLAPGTLVHVGEKKAESVRLRIMDFDAENLTEREAETIEESFPYRDKPTCSWINIDGLHDIEMIGKIGKHFKIHPLVLEDILNTNQRPKIEEYGDHIFIVMKMFFYDEQTDEINEEQVSLIFGKKYVLSFQEKVGDVFEPVRERIRKVVPRQRMIHADYLAYALLDAVVDHYFTILEKLGERIEIMEDQLLDSPSRSIMNSIHHLKRTLISLRRSVWPLREVVNSLEKSSSPLIGEMVQPYLRDVYDHTIQVMDTIETYRDMIAGMHDTYLSSVSNRMNEVMKVLTLIATIFIPLTFIAGIYGMNFERMPELSWHWAYPLGFWVVIFALIIFMVFYFRKRHWL
ncbi:MAG: magnesium/cobalt transporter CorA [bacterium]